MYIPYRLTLVVPALFKRWWGVKILKETYCSIHGKQLDFNNLETFTQKLFYRMVDIHNNKTVNRIFTRLADKILVRDYVKEKVGDKYLVDLIWSGKSPAKIPFEQLHKKCIIKTNHNSGCNIILDGYYNKKIITNKLKKSLNCNFYWASREHQYYGIDRKILIEDYIDDGYEDGPLDYRFWCFHGRPEVIQVDNHSHSINPFYDTCWNKLDLYYRNNFENRDILRPVNLSQMINIAAELSSDFDFVRVDLFNSSGKIFFGEMTFTPVAGRFKFNSDAWDSYLGSKWNIEP